MNKQQFLTELRGILSFMSEEDRDLTLASFDSLFEAFGESGENELLSRLVSPTRVAVELSRRYLSDGLEKALLPFGELKPEHTAEPAEEPRAVELADITDADDPMQQLAQEIFSDLPAYELSEPENMELIPEDENNDKKDEEAEIASEKPSEKAEGEDQPSDEISAEVPSEEPAQDPAPAAEPEQPKETPAPKQPVPQPSVPASAEEKPKTAAPAAEPWRAEKPEKARKADLTGAVVPIGLGIPMFLFIMLVLGLPLAFLFIAAIVVLLAPGAAGVGCAYLAAVACLWSINYVADTILLIGLALVLLSVGIIVLMGGIWLDIQLVIVYKQAVGWLAGALIGRRRKQ